MDLSIIIPAYNASEYIDDCIKSIFDNKFDEYNFELVVVNDGSTDDTFQKIVNWKNIHDNIRILNQKNLGVSISRNNAIDAAQGNYVTFLDADDWIGKNTLSAIVNVIRLQPEVDILISQMFNSESKKPSYDWTSKYFPEKNYTNSDMISNNFFRGSSCAVFYKRSYLKKNSLRFPEGIRLGEDTIFFSQCISFNCIVKFINIPFYYFRLTPQSACRTIDAKKIEDMLKAAEYCHMNLTEKECNTYQRTSYSWLNYQIITNTSAAAIHNNLFLSSFMKLFDSKKFLPISTNGIIKKKKMNICLMNFSYKLFFVLQYLKIKIQQHFFFNYFII